MEKISLNDVRLQKSGRMNRWTDKKRKWINGGCVVERQRRKKLDVSME